MNRFLILKQADGAATALMVHQIVSFASDGPAATRVFLAGGDSIDFDIAFDAFALAIATAVNNWDNTTSPTLERATVAVAPPAADDATAAEPEREAAPRKRRR